MSEGNASGAADPFMNMWSEMMKRASTMGMTPPQPNEEFVNQMRKAFFSSMSEQAEEFMRSDQFLTAMKQSMDNSLKFKQQMNQFLQSGLQTMQMPTRADTDHVVLLLRGLEERIVDKLDRLSERVSRLEGPKGNGSPSGSTSGVAKTTAKSKGR